MVILAHPMSPSSKYRHLTSSSRTPFSIPRWSSHLLYVATSMYLLNRQQPHPRPCKVIGMQFLNQLSTELGIHNRADIRILSILLTNYRWLFGSIQKGTYPRKPRKGIWTDQELSNSPCGLQTAVRSFTKRTGGSRKFGLLCSLLKISHPDMTRCVCIAIDDAPEWAPWPTPAPCCNTRESVRTTVVAACIAVRGSKCATKFRSEFWRFSLWLQSWDSGPPRTVFSRKHELAVGSIPWSWTFCSCRPGPTARDTQRHTASTI
jgi:hypothetical protein